MTPPSPYDGDTSPSECRAVWGKLIIAELELVWVDVVGGFGRVDRRRLVDAGDRLPHEETVADELGEADWQDGDAVQAGGDAQQYEGDHGGQDLQADGVFGSADEAPEVEMLLDPAEQQLDLPARLVEAGDGDGGALLIVGQQVQRLAIGMAAPGGAAARGRRPARGRRCLG